MSLDDLVLRNIFVYLYDAADRGAVANVCRRWRRNSMFVAPLSSLHYWVRQRNELLANLLLDWARENMGDRLPYPIVRDIVVGGLITTARRLKSTDFKFPAHLQRLLIDEFFPSYIRLNRLLVAGYDQTQRAMFEVVFGHICESPGAPWYSMVTLAVKYNRHYELRIILKDKRFLITSSDTWFRWLFHDNVLCAGNVKLSQLYVNCRYFATAHTDSDFIMLCHWGFSAIVRMYLRQRPELDINTSDGEPLLRAVKSNHWRVVKLLLADARLRIAETHRAKLLDEAVGSSRVYQLLVAFFS